MANSLLGNVVCQGKTRYLFFSFRWRQKSTLLSRRILETFITGFILSRLKKIFIKNISSSVLFARWFSMEKMWPFCKQSRARVCFPKELWANLIIERSLVQFCDLGLQCFWEMPPRLVWGVFIPAGFIICSI